jgi:hypothetical protein
MLAWLGTYSLRETYFVRFGIVTVSGYLDINSDRSLLRFEAYEGEDPVVPSIYTRRS